MPKPLAVICCVGLTPNHLGSATPDLTALASKGFFAPLSGVVPAVTTAAQTTMLTGVAPQAHGIVGNGWYARELGEVQFWKQSQRLVEAPHVWTRIRARRPGYKVLKHFWWYAMNTDADATVTPRPAYHHDGRKSPDFYAWPPALKSKLLARHQDFPLFQFWGPATSIIATRWIARSFLSAWDDAKPDLGLCYLPHLDYDLQRFGPTGAHLEANLRALDAEAGHVIAGVTERGGDVLVVSEYGIEAVDTAVFINRALREANLLEVSVNATGELLDPGQSRAFAVCDHQLAHVYCRDRAAMLAAQQVLGQMTGIDRIYSGADRSSIGLDHARSGELICLASRGAWFAYDYWLDAAKAPDFAQSVEIHKKPGYDPRELLFDPKGGKGRALRALLRKKLGLRYNLNPLSLDTGLVKGSHGRPPVNPDEGPVIIGSQRAWLRSAWHMTDVAPLIERLAE